MTDTLLILPTIGGVNVALAVDALNALICTSASPLHVRLLCDAMDEDIARNLVANVNKHGAAGWRALYQLRPERRGLVGAYRDGFTQFYADLDYRYLILMEDNIRVTPGWDTIMRRTLDAHPHFGWVACGQLENDRAPFTSLCSMLTREAALALDGGPDEAFAPCQFDDGDMFMRLLAQGFTPHAVDHKVSHPQARTSRVGTEADDWALIEAHRVIFQQRWGIPDFRWDLVPVHRGCGACRTA